MARAGLDPGAVARAASPACPRRRCPASIPTRCGRWPRSCSVATDRPKRPACRCRGPTATRSSSKRWWGCWWKPARSAETEVRGAPADAGAPSDVPATIRLLIAARLDTLPADQKELLQDASVCGTVTWDVLLAKVSDVADQRTALRALVARGLLRKHQRSTVPGATEYEWKHALIRDVAYDALPKAERAERHAQIAAWLRATSRGGREPIASIAHHYECAWQLAASKTGPDPDPEVARLAAEYLTRWAEQTFQWQARAAEPLFRRSLRVTEAGGPAVDLRTMARASLGLAEALIEMGSHVESIQRATRARRFAERARDDKLAARAMLALGRAESDAGRYRRARTLLENARARFEAAGDLRGQGWALHRLSETWGWAGLERELDDLRSAYRLFARARDRFGRAVVANDLAYILSVEGGAEFHRWYEQARRLVEGEGDLRSRASLLRTWGSFCYSAGRFTEAIGVAETVPAVGRRSGRPIHGVRRAADRRAGECPRGRSRDRGISGARGSGHRQGTAVCPHPGAGPVRDRASRGSTGKTRGRRSRASSGARGDPGARDPRDARRSRGDRGDVLARSRTVGTR